MNSLANNDFKIIVRFLMVIMVFVFSCDDIFVEDISGYSMQLKAPSSGWQGTDVNVSFRWEEVPEAINYQLEVVTPGFSVNHKLVFEKLLDVAKFDTLLTAGAYEWRIKALNPASETDYSTSAFVILTADDIASKQVTLKIPEDQFIGNTGDVNFSWDALEGANFYSFKIKKVNWMGDSVVVAKLYSTNFSFRLDDGLYTWGVAAIDTSTNKKTDYTIRSFTIDKNPPSVAVLLNPSNRDTLYSLTVAFNWRGTEPNSTYLIEIYSDPGLKNKVDAKTLSDTATYINMAESGYYYWNVKSTDQHGNSSNFSPVSAFYIQLPTDIDQGVVKLMSPANESTVVDKNVTFWWNLLNGAEKYNVQIASPTFANPLKLVYDQWVNSNSVTIELGAGNYEWRVKAANSTFVTGYSQSSFSVYNNDLTNQKTTLLKPLYAEQINKPIVNFSWEKINNYASYRLIVKKDSWELGTIVQEMGTTTTEVELPFLNGEYFWGIKAVDPQNSTETEYSIRKFVVDFKGDLSEFVVSLVSPTDKSVVNEKNVTFWWNPLTGSEKYNLQIATPSFTNPVKLIYDQWVTTNSVAIDLEPGIYEWRVKAANSIFETGFSRSSLTIYNNDMTKQRTTLLKPLSAELTNKSLVKFSWEKINSNANYHLLIKKDSWESGTIVQEMNTIKTEIELPFLDGEYFWGVKAVDPENNSETEYSTRKFEVDLIAPDIPGLKLPENNMVTGDLLLDFSWEPSDAADIKLTYNLEIFQILNNSVSQLASKTTLQKSIRHNFESPGKYKWRINAKDNAGNQSAFSEFRYFEIRSAKDLSASNVNLKSPVNGSTVIDKKVTLWWDALTGAEKYNIQIVTPTFANPLKLISDQWVTTNTLAIDLEAGNYEWRVKAANSTSETGYRQSSFSVYNNDLTRQKTTLLKPLASELTNKSLVKFSWEKINSNAIYHLIIKKDSWESGTIVHEMNTDKTEIEFSFLDGEYFWGIKAIDPENNKETEYSMRKFGIDLTVPDIPGLKSPANNLVTENYLLNFTWEPLDVTDTKLTYNLEIYKILSNSVIQLTSKTILQKSFEYNIESGGKYKWRISAKDNAGNQSAFSEYRYFEIHSAKDLSASTVNLKSPVNGSTVIDKNVTFWWDALTGAEKYNIQVVTPTFANPLKLISDQWVTTNSLAIQLEAGNFEWRVKAANSTSETGYCQSSFSIYNNDLTKQKTTLLKPLYAELINTRTVKFSWERLNSTVNYHFLVKKDSWETGIIVQEMNTRSADVELSFLDGEYFWGVKAVDLQNNSETVYSTRKFGIDLTAPDIPKLKFPANNLITAEYLIDFSWEPGDVADTKLTYTLELYKTNNVGSQLASKTTQQKSVGYNFDSVGKYKWRVYATDAAGNQSSFSEYRYFEIQ